jgi:hypothetical protein
MPLFKDRFDVSIRNRRNVLSNGFIALSYLFILLLILELYQTASL